MPVLHSFVRPFDALGIDDVPEVGGKNASLGEMYRSLSSAGVKVPNGFAITAGAYRYVLDSAGAWAALHGALDDLRADDSNDLSRRGELARNVVYAAGLPPDLQSEILDGYRTLLEEYGPDLSLAVRSSATAEDAPTASFAGQQESYVHIRGEEQLLDACRRCFASLFTDRAIHYRVDKGFDHYSMAMSIGVQKMVRSDIGTSGVMFSLDTESGFRDVVLISGAYGLGENVVQGAVDPDEFFVFKPTFSAGHRTVLRRRMGSKKIQMAYSEGEVATQNIATPLVDQQRFCTGTARVIASPADIGEFQTGEVLVTDSTTPDWEPVMKRAAAIVTNRGGRTCHAAIVARELGIPAVIGVGDATERLRTGEVLTVSCADGEVGKVFRGAVPFEGTVTDTAGIARPKTQVMLIVGNPDIAFQTSMLPNDGVGLARMEFIISEYIKAHPMALLHPERVEDAGDRASIDALTRGYETPSAFSRHFDGFSIGSNDLTQLTLGVDRDSETVAFDFDERDPGMLTMFRLAVEGAKRNGRHIGICGQAPSDFAEIAEFLVNLGIDSISLNPDSVVRTTQQILKIEHELGR